MGTDKMVSLDISVDEFIRLKIQYLQSLLENLEFTEVLKQMESLPDSAFRKIEIGEEIHFPSDTFKPSQRAIKPSVLDFFRTTPGKHTSADVWSYLKKKHSLKEEKRSKWMVAISQSIHSLHRYQKLVRHDDGQRKEYEINEF